MVRFLADASILVTHDVRTMPRHFADFLATGATSPGVFLVKQHTPLASVLEDLVLIWTASTPDDWTNRIVSIPIH